MSRIVNLSEAASLGIHAMVYLAHSGEDLVKREALAEAIGCSFPHMEKVLKLLISANLIKTFRGPRGGLSLNQDPGEISLKQVYEAIEGPLNPTECSIRGCPFDFCELARILDELSEEASKRFASISIADMAENIFTETSS
ncbi:MAG: Rrf2 family transcriptional regulator [Synergistales bacterium]|nr:Rrf2 family transcriptional regulator [Synergistales bacterium]